MLRKSKPLHDGRSSTKVSFAEAGPRCAYCRSAHLARSLTLLSFREPPEATTLCFSCRLEAVDLGYQVVLLPADLC